MNKQEKLKYWQELWHDARAKRVTLDAKIARRNELYKGTSRVKDRRKADGSYSSNAAYTYRNMCFELIETQINNGVPAPKVTPRDKGNIELALTLEGYLKSEMDRLQSEAINDEAERGTYKQGCTYYHIGWDESVTTPTTRGELFMRHYPLERLYMQPGCSGIDTAEYVFALDTVSIKKLKLLYNVTIPEGPEFKGLNTLITAWYYNDNGYVSRFGWIKDTDYIVFDDEDYELRQIKVCTKCGEPILDELICPVCQSTSFKWTTAPDEEIPEDIVKGDPTNPNTQPLLLVKKGQKVGFYKIKQLPFVMRVNISDDESPYGISDIDVLEQNQEGLNKVHTKMEQNILKAGSFVTVPKGVNVPNTDETLKIIQIKDPNMMKAFGVYTVQANSQQDDVWADRMYQFGRGTLGITDSYQGKRDPTAESGKAKEISAAQAAGRLESKRRMKDAAYAEIYKLMFKFLLAYCDEERTFTKVDPLGDTIEGSFSRYNFLDGVPNNVYYNDRYLFSVDTASVLSTSREAMWGETTRNFQAGTFGNPTDPQSVMLYWNVMKDLGYPLAKQSLSNLQKRSTQLPFEMQQAIMNNPEILKAVQQVIQEGGTDSENSKSSN